MKLKLGEKIYEYRRKMNMTQKQFAEKLGVSYQSVSRWENEQTYPDIELIPSIADIFKISIDSLMGIEEIERKIKQMRFLIHFGMKQISKILMLKKQKICYAKSEEILLISKTRGIRGLETMTNF